MYHKRLFLLMAIAILIPFYSLNAAPDYDHEILTMFAPKVVDWPLGKITMSVEDVTFNTPVIKDILLAHSAHTISLAFPNADPKDTIRYCKLDPSKFVRRIKVDLVYKIYLNDDKLRDDLNAELNRFKEVFFSHNNGTIKLETNDIHFNKQWGLNNTGQAGGPTDVDIDAPEAWALEHGEAVTTIAILDTGVKLNHEDLSGKVTGDWPFLFSHGTHVAGIAAAKTNNSIGVAGVGWNINMISKCVLNISFQRLYSLIWELINHPDIQIMNCSWSNGSDVELVHMAFASAYHIGDAMVLARGNADSGYQGDERYIYPACFGDWIISVGALTHLNEKAFYSHYGNGMDFLAPGGSEGILPFGIYSTIAASPWYDWAAGTSMAAPHVTGIIALLHDYTGLVLSDDFETLLKHSCIDIYPPGYDPETGWGRVNADSALKLVTFPNEVFKYRPAHNADPYLYSQTGQYVMRCVGWSGLFNQDYRVKRYEYRADIVFADDFHKLFSQTPIVWGTGILTNGLTYENPNYYVPYCGVVDGTITSEGATLKSYYYEVWDMDNNYLGWYPANPNDQTFHYSLVGNASPSSPTGLSVSPSTDYHPLIQWDQNTESDLQGYKIYRHVRDWEDDWSLIGSAPASSNRFIDYDYTTGHSGVGGPSSNADYRVTAYDLAGTESMKSDSVTIKVLTPEKPWPIIRKTVDKDIDNSQIPDSYQLQSIYPNPFNSQAIIKYGLPELVYVRIDIFNLSGQKVETILNEYKSSGYHEIIWDASDMPSGVYFCKINAGNFTETRRMALIK